ncbi:hypothetical protein C8F01DRAFT_1169692 [Mycena amicta]|nr:hypothetical protein C8F01DRAFT_1169692 [Mycena amicta]
MMVMASAAVMALWEGMSEHGEGLVPRPYIFYMVASADLRDHKNNKKIYIFPGEGDSCVFQVVVVVVGIRLCCICGVLEGRDIQRIKNG